MLGPNAPLHFAFPLQSLSPLHGAHLPPLQTPLLQSALAVHALPSLRMQKWSWQIPPAHSVFSPQRAPPGALQAGAAHTFDAQSPLALQAVQIPLLHSPLAHKASSVQAVLV